MAQMNPVPDALERPVVSAVILSYNRRRALEIVLDRLAELPVDEIVIFDNASSDGTQEMVHGRADDKINLIESGRNIGFGGRNIAAEAARGDLLLMLDDDSYPLPGAVERLTAAFVRDPKLAVAGGLVIDVDEDGVVLRHNEAGTFDWFFRAGRTGDIPEDGLPVFFFPEGACMIRKEPYLEIGGFFEPYFFAGSEGDLATQLVGRGWDVRYLPQATFEHMKAPEGRFSTGEVLRYRVRNQIWYFYRHYPWSLAARRIPAYLAFDLIECSYRGAFRHWAGGIADAWRQRRAVAGTRRPLTRGALRRAEMNRGRLHLRLLWAQLYRRLVRGSAKTARMGH